MNIHLELGIGLDEHIYRNALLHDFAKDKVPYDCEKVFKIYYDGVVVGTKRIDLIANNSLVLELKARPELTLRDELQLVNYLRITGIDHGLLINFGSPKLQIKRKFRSPSPAPPSDPPTLN